MLDIKIKSKLIKLDSLQSLNERPFIYVKTGDVLIGYFRDWPVIGDQFCFIEKDSSSRLPRPLYTTIVSELIDNRTFKTKNSIYKIVTMDDERDEKIKIILQ